MGSDAGRSSTSFGGKISIGINERIIADALIEVCLVPLTRLPVSDGWYMQFCVRERPHLRSEMWSIPLHRGMSGMAVHPGRAFMGT